MWALVYRLTSLTNCYTPGNSERDVNQRKCESRRFCGKLHLGKWIVVRVLDGKILESGDGSMHALRNASEK
jgi:hypothetical protein